MEPISIYEESNENGSTKWINVNKYKTEQLLYVAIGGGYPEALGAYLDFEEVLMLRNKFNEFLNECVL
jgi:hypothetical protein